MCFVSFSPGLLYPAEGTSTPLELDGSSPLIPLQRPFVYFGKTYEQIFVNNNGHLTFDAEWYSYIPEPVPVTGSRDFIAALWSDFDIRHGGQITYNQYTYGSVLQQATQDINAHFPELHFTAEFVFVATWTDVPYYDDPSSQSTFQAVLISSDEHSFLLLNYGSLASTVYAVQAGYDTINSTHFFSLPGSFSDSGSGPSSTFSLGSNINVAGRWAFRVDHGSRDCLRIFYPAEGTSTPLEPDGSSPLIPLQRPFVYFGKTYEQIFVNNNGHLTFDEAFSGFLSESIPLFGTKDIIFPLWSDFDIRHGGQITYNQYTNGSVLQQATQDINAYLPGLDFTAEFVFVATWTDVPYYDDPSSQSTFQAVLISGDEHSFLLLNYGSLAPSFNAVQAGYDTVNFINFVSLPGSFSDTALGPNSTFSLGSNINVAGRWAFRVDHGSRDCLSGLLYPAEGTSVPLVIDGSSPLIPLQRPFVYFGKTYEQIFVSTNGHLTFDAGSSDFTANPIPGFGSSDIIAPLWTDFDVTNGGQITYNQYTSGSVLQQATQDINAHLPGLDFTAEFVFVAAWTDVPYFNNPSTQSTFQAVLISGGHYSFLLLNYGSIASNSLNSQAGYDTINSTHFFSLPGSFSASATGPNSAFSLGSNVDVAGLWVFRVDHGTRDCLSEPTQPTPSAHGGSYGNKRRRRRSMKSKRRRSVQPEHLDNTAKLS
ncbi:uncharacterized protein V6R79_023783 [Siganus canaliculatus]